MQFREHPSPQSSALASIPWFGALGSQSLYGEPFGQLKSLSVDHPSFGDHQLTEVPRQAQRDMNQGPPKQNYSNTMFPGDDKDSLKVQKPHYLPAIVSRQSSPPEYQACFELGLGQPLICANYPNMTQCYGLFATYGAQTMGRRMLPLNMKTEDGPVFVNAKQYNGIMRRRQSRAKAELANKAIKVRKAYMHESRHLHAMRRARGCGGRFLTKNTNSGKGRTEKEKEGIRPLSQQSGSLSSEVVHSEERNVNEACGGRSHQSGTEVTSMYTRGDLDCFQIDHLRTSAFHSLSNVMDSGQVISMSNKWITAADGGCCDFLKV